MTIIRMETEAVRGIATQLSQIVEVIRGELQSATQTSVSVNWEGPNRDQFVAEVGSIARQVEALAQQAEQLGSRVTREVEEWEQMAATLGEGLQPIDLPFPMPFPGPLPMPGPKPMPMPMPAPGPLPGPGPVPMPFPIPNKPTVPIEQLANDFNTQPEQTFDDLFNRIEDGSLDIADVSEVIKELIESGKLGPEGLATLTIKLLKYVNSDPNVGNIINSADDALSLKQLLTVVATNGTKGNPAFALAWFVSKHESWTPYADNFAEWATTNISNGLFTVFSPDNVGKVMDVMQVATYPLDVLMGTTTPDQIAQVQQFEDAMKSWFDGLMK